MESESYRSVIVKQAEEDIAETLAYISDELKNPTAAQKLLADILSTIETITAFPYSMATVKNDDITLGREYRRAEVNNFVLIYKIVEQVKEVRIMAAFYGASDVISKLLNRIP